jgi:translation initiation factor 1
VVVRLERKGRGGKTVTVIEGLRMTQAEAETLLRYLKSQLGTGGTRGQNGLEVQGDHRDAVMEVLQRRGYRPKRSG